ncbi:MAG: multidrug transporter [Spirochaetes bacterium]|nr:multidrug transporter [Spirochaetota bacterium]
MEFFLQYWGGIGYFLAKVLLVRAEFIEKNRNLRLVGWFVYLMGLPAWVILLASRQNWIAAAIETAGVPAILLGIVMTWKQNNNPNKIIDWGIRVFTCFMIIIGVLYSIYTFNGIRTISQILEIIIIFGYLVSNYLLAKRNPFAWLMFMVGLISMSILMYIQDKPILCIQQLISLIPAVIGFIKNMKQQRLRNQVTN